MNKISIDEKQGSYYHRKILEDTRAIELLSRGPTYSKYLKQRPKVLVADDEQAIRNLVKRTLETQLNAEVFIAHNGEEAVKLIQKNSFDLIISDMLMPLMTGLELYHWIQINAPDLSERFFIISGDLGGSSVFEDFQNYGIQILTKPFLISKLLETSVQYLQTQRSSI